MNDSRPFKALRTSVIDVIPRRGGSCFDDMDARKISLPLAGHVVVGAPQLMKREECFDNTLPKEMRLFEHRLTIKGKQMWNNDEKELKVKEKKFLGKRKVALLGLEGSMGGQQLVYFRIAKYMYVNLDVIYIAAPDSDVVSEPLFAMLQNTSADIELLTMPVQLYNDDTVWSKLYELLLQLRIQSNFHSQNSGEKVFPTWSIFETHLEPSLARALLSIISQLRKFDIVSVSNHMNLKEPVLLYLAACAGVQARIAVMCNVTTPDYNVWMYATAIEAPSRFALDASSYFVMKNDVDNKHLCENYKCSVNPPVVVERREIPIQCKQKKEAQITIGTLGRLAVERSPGMFIRVAEHFFKKESEKSIQNFDDRYILPQGKFENGGKIEFVVIGGGSYLNSLEYFAAKKVKFLGELSHQAAQLELCKFDIYVVARFGETFGIATVEAMSNEVVPIGCALGGFAEIVQHGKTGILVDCASDDINIILHRYKNAITWLLENEEKRREMGRNAKNWVENVYSKNNFVKRYNDFFGSLIN
eukprot:g2538.t1